jgi:hypothetical protein
VKNERATLNTVIDLGGSKIDELLNLRT